MDFQVAKQTYPTSYETQPVMDETPQAIDAGEFDEWFESLDDLLHRHGPDEVRRLMANLQTRAYQRGVAMPFTANTPYINTIHHEQQPRFPGNREVERRIKSLIRWNAMAIVVRANAASSGIGGEHISTYASAATLLEIGFNHFFQARNEEISSDDFGLLPGHAAPGVYARAFLEGRLTEEQLLRFRREIPRGQGYRPIRILG